MKNYLLSTTSMFYVAFVISMLPQYYAQAESALGFAYDDVTSCSGSVVEMNSLSFECNGESSASCILGDEVTMTGQFTTILNIPSEVNIKVQICKFWGYVCTSYLVNRNTDICDYFDNNDNNNNNDDNDSTYCAAPGTYDYQTSFVLPEASLSNFAVNGVSFRIYVSINDEFTCHAQFTTIKYYEYTASSSSRSTSSNNNNTMSVSILGVVMIILSVFSVFEMNKRHQRWRTVTPMDYYLHGEPQQEEMKQQVQEDEEIIDFSPMLINGRYVTL